MLVLLWILAGIGGAAYLNVGYDLTSQEKAKSKKKGWDKFHWSWLWFMLILPITTFSTGVIKTVLFPAMRRHKKRIKEVEARMELDAEEGPKLLEEGAEGAERAAKGIPDPEPESPLNEALSKSQVTASTPSTSEKK